MRLVLLTSLLLTTLSNVWSAQARDIQEGDVSYARILAELDTLDTGRTGLGFVLSQNLNLTTPGKRRGTKRTLPRSSLQERQDVRFPIYFLNAAGLGRALTLAAA